jgi:hypothetical protein
MALDYTSLQADIAAWMARTDLTTAIPSFVQLAEPEIGRRVRTLDMETDTTLTANSGNSYAPALPTGFLGLKHCFVSGASNPRTTYVTPQVFHELKNMTQSAFFVTLGDGSIVYTIESGKLKVFQSVGATDPITLDICYHKKFDALATTPTNTLLTNHYDIYLWASLMQAWDYIDDEKNVAKYERKLDRAIGQLDDSEAARRRGAGPLVRRASTSHARP